MGLDICKGYVVFCPMENASGNNLSDIIDILRGHTDILMMYVAAKSCLAIARSVNVTYIVLAETTRNKQRNISKLWHSTDLVTNRVSFVVDKVALVNRTGTYGLVLPNACNGSRLSYAFACCVIAHRSQKKSA